MIGIIVLLINSLCGIGYGSGHEPIDKIMRPGRTTGLMAVLEWLGVRKKEIEVTINSKAIYDSKNKIHYVFVDINSGTELQGWMCLDFIDLY